MLEKLNTPGFETLSRPDHIVLNYLDKVLQTTGEPIVYEIGVGIGATTLPMAERLGNRGKILLFSRDNDVRELTADLRQRGFGNIDSDWGSPNKTYSGYHFELARGMVSGLLPPLDLAYLDGGHVFHLDAAAAAVLKELCRPGGYIILDDYRWSLQKSPTMNPSKRPATATEYDQRQIEACHVELVCKVLMDTDRRFRMIESQGNTVVYQKIRSE